MTNGHDGQGPTLRSRYNRIVRFFAGVIGETILLELILAPLGLRGWVRRTRPARLVRQAHGFRLLAIQMGGVLIKVGQFLSSRVDILPDEVTRELAGLQDEVPAEAFTGIRQLLEKELGGTIAEKFQDFEVTPMAAASLGQVHRALLPTGEKVVVKVQRPNIELLINTDLAALRTVSRWLKRYGPIRRRVDLDALLAEFSRVLFEEIDYLAEGRNAETFAANFADNPGVRVPKVYWTHTTRRVLTLEDVYAIKITDYAAITAAGVDRAEVAERLFQVYLKQVFEDGWFHADPHPGNLFVEPLDLTGLQEKRPWRLTFVDYGAVGRIPPQAKASLREIAIAIGLKDTARMIQAYQQLGVLLPGADLELIQQAVTKAFDRFWGKTMAELRAMPMSEFHDFAREFRQLIFEMPFQIPVDLLYLGRTVAILSGIATGLNPDFNVWTGVMPFAQKLIAEELRGPGLEFWLAEMGNVVRALLALPGRLESAFGKIDRGEVIVHGSLTPELAQRIDRLTGAINRLVGSVIFIAFFAVGAMLYTGGQETLGGVSLLAAMVTLIAVLTGGRGKD